jgi:osmotically inducible protein OsmC
MGRINPLFTATATAIGGRNGHTESNDGLVKADLSVPKAAPRQTQSYWQAER